MDIILLNIAEPLDINQYTYPVMILVVLKGVLVHLVEPNMEMVPKRRSFLQPPLTKEKQNLMLLWVARVKIKWWEHISSNLQHSQSIIKVQNPVNK